MLADFLTVRLGYPGTVELAEFWRLGLDILVPLGWLIFGKLGLDILVPLSWLVFEKLGLDILVLLSWQIFKVRLRYPGTVELADFSEIRLI